MKYFLVIMLLLNSKQIFAENYLCEALCVAPGDEFDQVSNIIFSTSDLNFTQTKLQELCRGKSARNYPKKFFGSMSITFPFKSTSGGISTRSFNVWNQFEHCELQNDSEKNSFSCHSYCGGITNQFSLPPMFKITGTSKAEALQKLAKQCVGIDAYQTGMYITINETYNFRAGSSELQSRNAEWASMKNACKME